MGSHGVTSHPTQVNTPHLNIQEMTSKTDGFSVTGRMQTTTQQTSHRPVSLHNGNSSVACRATINVGFWPGLEKKLGFSEEVFLGF